MTSAEHPRSFWEHLLLGTAAVCMLHLRRPQLAAAYREISGKDVPKALKNFDIELQLAALAKGNASAVEVVKRAWQDAKADRRAKDFERKCVKAGLRPAKARRSPSPAADDSKEEKKAPRE